MPARPTIHECFGAYREEYAVREPKVGTVHGDAEVEEFPLAPPEFLDLDVSPTESFLPGEPPVESSQEANKYLWVIREVRVPLGLESGATGQAIAGRGRLSHTNLTGGRPAYCGGELWITDSGSFAINGGSGRYGPETPEELEAAVQAFRLAGYRVACCGWDEGTGTPARNWLRTGLVWLEPLDG